MNASLRAALVILLLIPAFAACGGSTNPTAPAPAPTVASCSPGAGFVTGGTPVTVIGTDFNDATAVTFAGAPAAGLTVVSATTILATTPPGPGGLATVAVTTPAGTGSGNAFTYVSYPPVASSEVQVDDEGASEQARPMDEPAMCCDGPRVYVAWAENRAPSGRADVFFQRSLDRGATWEPVDRLVNTNGAGVSDSRWPFICCSGDQIYVLWMDNRDGGTHLLYLNSSTDGGASFYSSDARVSVGTPVGIIYQPPTICCTGRHVYVAWRDDRNGIGNADVFVNRSIDAGRTWLASDARVSTYAPASGPFPGSPDMCCEGANVYVTWSDTRSVTHSDAWLTRSTDGGASWLPAETRVDRDTSNRNVRDPVLSCVGTDIQVVWRDDRHAAAPFGGYDLYANTSTDGGSTFAPTDVRVNTSGMGILSPSAPRTLSTGTTVHVAWTDNRAGPYRVFYNRSTDNGATYGAADRRLDSGAGGSEPQISGGGEAIHVTWTEVRATPKVDIFINSSANNGATWLATDVRLDGDVPAPGNSLAPQLCCDGAIPYVVWRDDRNATVPYLAFDVFFASYVP